MDHLRLQFKNFETFYLYEIQLPPNTACTRTPAKCAGAVVVGVGAFSISFLAQAAEDNKEQFFGIIRLA